MSLAEIALRHDRLEAEAARQAVRAYLKGDRPGAEWLMSHAATHRHLSVEAWDTRSIASETRRY